MSDPDVGRFVREGETYTPYLPAEIDVPSVDEQLGTDFSSVSFLTDAGDGNGGGISLALFSVRPFAVVEILFKNLSITDNEAIVGGEMSAMMTLSHCRTIQVGCPPR